ncbi:MAG: TraM recognition domain-containing protein [Candidatus Nanogingivalaceae bacterium]|nr:MAG: TraM recognition domain-containing protein [Candidatus Nanogingivalaceae bacterium]QWB91696.1 MAG: TraM recognition domain-containing protein [Candidatus Nanogingivalaceae bacterium]
MSIWIILFISFIIICVAAYFVFDQYKKMVREAKNYERGLKMVPIRIHLPPPSDDLETGGRDERDVVDEVLSEAQTMYNIIASTAMKGFKTRLYGQRHISFEIVASDGLVRYYAVVPAVLTETIKQAISAAYPAARLEEVEMENIFSQQGKMQGVIGGEFELKKDFYYPIATYQESRRDAARALLDALSGVERGDGAAIQIMFRPAPENWTNKSNQKVESIRNGKSKKSSAAGALDIMEALWKPPTYGINNSSADFPQLTALENEEIQAIEDKTKYPGYEVLTRVITSSSTAAKSQAILQSIVSAFSLFDSPRYNGFKFNMTTDVDELITAYIFRFFPQSTNKNILNSVELSTIFHLPDQNSIPTGKVERQRIRQVDGPTEPMREGLLIGVNEFRGIEKQIRLGINDRRRHTYIIGQTGMGKSKLLENLAYQDIMEGRGFCFIDPHGDSAEELLGMIPQSRMDDVIYFNPSDTENPLGFNIFEIESPEDMDFVISETNSMLKSLFDPGNTGVVGPRMENIVRNAALLLMSDPDGGTFMDIPKVLVDPEFAKQKIKYLRNQRAIDFWTKEWPASQRSNDAGELVSWVVSKWAPFESGLINNIIGQKKSAFNIREVMDNNKILLVNLSKGKLGEAAAKLLGMVFVMKFQAAAMSRADIPEDERKDFCLFVDEFQNFATDSFESILSEARKYRLNLILANQFTTQLKDSIKDAIFGNVPNKIVGRVGIDDAEILQKAFTPTFTAEDLTKTPNYNSITTVLVNGFPSAPFTMKLLPPIGRSNSEIREGLRKYSASKYGRPRAIVEDEIRKRLSVNPTPKPAQRPMSPTVPQVAQKPQISWQERAINATEPASANSSSKPQDSFLDDWIKKRDELRNKTVSTEENNVPKSNLARTFQKNILQTQQQNSSGLQNKNNPQIQQQIRSPQMQYNSVIQDITSSKEEKVESNRLSIREEPSQDKTGSIKKIGNDEVIFKIR